MIKKIGLMIIMMFIQFSTHTYAAEEIDTASLTPINKHNPVVVVTGGNRGIGFEICRQLASRGAQVVMTARNKDLGEEAVQKLASQGLSVKYFPLEVTKPESVTALRQFLDETFGHIDVLINNAGVNFKEKDSIQGDNLDVMRQTIEINTIAPFAVSTALVPLLKRSQMARIINLSTGLSQFSTTDSFPAFPAYRISKAALNSVTKILAKEYRGIIAVNSVCPGWVKTDMGGSSAERDVSVGAAGPVWHALFAPQDLTGRFTRDTKEIGW